MPTNMPPMTAAKLYELLMNFSKHAGWQGYCPCCKKLAVGKNVSKYKCADDLEKALDTHCGNCSGLSVVEKDKWNDPSREFNKFDKQPPPPSLTCPPKAGCQFITRIPQPPPGMGMDPFEDMTADTAAPSAPSIEAMYGGFHLVPFDGNAGASQLALPDEVADFIESCEVDDLDKIAQRVHARLVTMAVRNTAYYQ